MCNIYQSKMCHVVLCTLASYPGSKESCIWKSATVITNIDHSETLYLMLSKFYCHSECKPDGESILIGDCFGSLVDQCDCPFHPDAECVASCCNGTIQYFDQEGNDVTSTCNSECYITLALPLRKRGYIAIPKLICLE